MPFPTPKLDDRRFEDIVAEARELITRFCPEWTDHNDSDPGITLIQVFAWLMDMLLYRMNKIPELHYIKFLELLGLPVEPLTAHANVTFWFTDPLQKGKEYTIPVGTEVATTQTEIEPAQIFMTKRAFLVRGPQLERLIIQKGKTVVDRATVSSDGYIEHINSQSRQGGIKVFPSQPPLVDDALYLGFTANLSRHILRLDVDVQPLQATGGGREAPPYIFEVCRSKEENLWVTCPFVEPDADRTENLNKSSSIKIYVPDMIDFSLDNSKDLFWVRLRLKEAKYTEKSPILYRIRAAVLGCEVECIHKALVQEDERLGQSSGAPGQRFRLQHAPILPRDLAFNEACYVQPLQGEQERWEEVASFSDTPRQDGNLKKCYVLNNLTGELCFPPAISLHDGSIQRYGAVPPEGATIVFKRYRYVNVNSNHQFSSVKQGKINTLKTSNPAIKRVENRKASSEEEPITLERIGAGMAHLLRTRERAVTEEDFVYLATEGFNRAEQHKVIARAWCVAPTAPKDNSTQNPAQPLNTVRVLVLCWPKMAETSDQLDHTSLEPDDATRERLNSFLKKRCLLTTDVKVGTPKYFYIKVVVEIRWPEKSNRSELSEKILKKLYAFLHPITGGFAGKGWRLGEFPRSWEIYRLLCTGEGAISSDRIARVLFFRTDEKNETQAAYDEDENNTDPAASPYLEHVIVSKLHDIKFLEQGA